MMNLDEIFTFTDNTFRLTIEQEREAIVLAQAGDEEALEALLRAYGRTMRKAVGNAKKTIEEEDARAAALLAFTETLYSHDVEDENYADPRLASRLTPNLLDRMGKEQARAQSFKIPKRSLTRFYYIVNLAEGDVETAREICGQYEMSRARFDEILQVVNSGSLEGAAIGRDDEDREVVAKSIFDVGSWETEVEDRLLVEAAFAAVDDEEARIVELRYGFRSTEDYAAGEEIPDGEVAQIVGLTRPTVQRRRNGALSKMREAIAVPEVDEG